MTKQYTNTREPGEFGDGVTVEKMTNEELVEKLRIVNIATAPYACPEAVDWCHEAADRLAAPSPLSPRVKASDILSQVALWSDDEGLDLSMGQGEDLVRRIMSAIELSASPRVVTVEREGESVVAKNATTASADKLEVVGYVKEGDYRASGFEYISERSIDVLCVPLVRHSDATRIITACQQEVEWLRAASIASGNALYEARVRNAELVKALEEIASDDERGDYEGVVQFARAALGGQSNE